MSAAFADLEARTPSHSPVPDGSLSTSPGNRITWLDRARGVAIGMMIAGHAADAFLSDRYRAGPGWEAFNIALGFVAPIFLLISGISLWISVRQHPGLSRPLLRAVQILALGYWLQIPVLSLRQLIWNHRPDEIARVFDVNILQAIGLPMLLVIAAVRLTGSVDRARWIALAVAILLVLIAPLAWHGSLHFALARLFGPQPDVTFPLAPYAAYHLAGFAFAPLLLRAAGSMKGAAAMFAASVGLVAVSAAGAALLAGAIQGDFWHGSVPHTFFRLGGVLAFLAGVVVVDFAIRSRAGLVAYSGRRSLRLYLLHLIVIYGSPMTMGMRYWYGAALNRSNGPAETAALAAIVAAAVVAGSVAWDRLRHRDPRTALALVIGWWVLFGVLFLVRP